MCYTSNCLDECDTGRFALSNAINPTQYLIVGKAPRISGLTSRHSSRQRWQASAGRFVMPSHKRYTDEQILEIHKWYTGDNLRTMKQAAERINASAVTLQSYFRRLGLPIKSRGGKLGSRRGQLVILSCEVCQAPFELLESEYRARINAGYEPRFCSKKCANISSIVPESKTVVACDYCGQEFVKRTDHVGEFNYCSKECHANSRRKSDAKWRDPQYIKSYMQKYASDNRDRLNVLSREYTQAHKEQKLLSQKKYRQTHKAYIAFIQRVRRQKIYSAEFDESEWEEMKKAFDYTCPACKRKEPEIKLEMDHVTPISLGGEHHISNLQPLCRTCNAAKGTKIIDYR